MWKPQSPKEQKVGGLNFQYLDHPNRGITTVQGLSECGSARLKAVASLPSDNYRQNSRFRILYRNYTGYFHVSLF